MPPVSPPGGAHRASSVRRGLFLQPCRPGRPDAPRSTSPDADAGRSAIGSPRPGQGRPGWPGHRVGMPGRRERVLPTGGWGQKHAPPENSPVATVLVGSPPSVTLAACAPAGTAEPRSLAGARTPSRAATDAASADTGRSRGRWSNSTSWPRTTSTKCWPSSAAPTSTLPSPELDATSCGGFPCHLASQWWDSSPHLAPSRASAPDVGTARRSRGRTRYVTRAVRLLRCAVRQWLCLAIWAAIASSSGLL